MEHVQISLDDGTGAKFDEALRDTLPDGGDLRVVTKDNGTVGGRPIVMLTFTAQLPDGSVRRVQTVTTVRQFQAVAAAIRGRYGEVE
jgi:hypothetical protein